MHPQSLQTGRFYTVTFTQSRCRKRTNSGKSSSSCWMFAIISIQVLLFPSGGWFLNDLTFMLQWLVLCSGCFNLGEKMLFMWATQSCFCIIIQHHCSNYWSSARGRLLCFSFYHTRCQVAVANHHIKGLELNLSSYPSSKTLTYVAGNKVMICRLFILLSTFFLFKSSLKHPFKKLVEMHTVLVDRLPL